MFPKIVRKIQNLAILGLGVLFLGQCSGMGGSPGGTAPGGAPGEMPSLGTMSGGGGAVTAPLPISAPVAAAGGGILSAGADDEALTECGPLEARWRLRYHPGFTQILDAEASKNTPSDYQLTGTRRAPLLLEGSRIADLQGNWSEWYSGMSGYQVRMVLFREGGPIQYQDATLPFHRLDQEPNAVFQDIPAKAGDLLRLYVYQERKIEFEKVPGGRVKHCLMVPPPGFQAAPGWAELKKADLAAFEQSPHAHYVGTFRVAGFLQNDADYVVEVPFLSIYRLRYGDQNGKILDGNPKTPPPSAELGADKKLRFLLEWNYTKDYTKYDRVWVPLCKPGPQVRMLVIGRNAQGAKTFWTQDYTLDGWVQFGNGRAASFDPEQAPAPEELKHAYNVVFSNMNLEAGERVEFYYFPKINGPKSTPPNWVYDPAPPVTDEKSYIDFKSDPDTFPLGAMIL